MTAYFTHLSIFAGEPAYIHQAQQGLWPLLTPLKAYPPSGSFSIQLATDTYMDVLVTIGIVLALICTMIVVPFFAMSLRDKTKRFALTVLSFLSALLLCAGVIISSLQLMRSQIIIWDMIFVGIIALISGVVLFTHKRTLRNRTHA